MSEVCGQVLGEVERERNGDEVSNLAGLWRVTYRGKYRFTIYLSVDSEGVISQIPALWSLWEGRKFSDLCKFLKRHWPKSFERQKWGTARCQR